MNILNLIKNREIIKTVRLKKGQTLFHENDKCECIGIIESGTIIITSYHDDGNQVVFNQLKENEIFGNNLVFSSSPYYKGDVVCLTDVNVSLIYRHDLIKLLMSNEEFLTEYLKIQSNFGKSLNSKIKLLSFDSAFDRLMFFLSENNGCYRYSSVTELASMLGVKRETLSRLLSRLVKDEVIYISNKTIELISQKN